MDQRAFRSGAAVAEHLDGVDDEQVQPNGVDLTVEDVKIQRGGGSITKDGKQIADRVSIQRDDDSLWRLSSPVIVQYAEEISIPEGHIGFVLPRSSLLRNSCVLHTAVWDAGYEGKGEGLLVPHEAIDIEKGARIGQMIYATANHDGEYDGSYQGERL